MGADEILYVPVSEIVADAAELHPNYGRSSRRSRAKREIEFPAADLYAGFEKLLVRTALIRAEGVSLTTAPVLDSAEHVAELCKHLVYADQEHMVTLPLNAGNRLLAIHEAAIGHGSGAAQTPQHLLKVAFLTSARALIMVHNHPSGDPRPSPDDARMTALLLHVAACVEVEFLDHVIVAEDGWVSFADTPNGIERAAENYSATRFSVQKWR